MLLLSFAMVAAFAADPVLVPGDDLRRSERRLRFDLGVRNVDVRLARELARQRASYLVGTRPLSRCRGEGTDNARILRLLAQAEELRLVMRADDWFARLKEAEQAWWCLEEPADASLGSRLHFVLGIAHHSRGDVEAASEAFRTALRSDPELAWDNEFAPGARPTFEALRSAEPPVDLRITVVPATAAIAIRVDGRSVAVEKQGFALPPGPHLLQVDGDSWWIDLQSDDWLVVPRFVDGAVVAGIDTPSGRFQAQGLFQDVGEPVFVAGERSSWSYDADQWTEHRAPLRRRAAMPLTVGGLVVVAGGLSWMAVELLESGRRANQVDDELGTPEYRELEERQAAARTRWRIAAATTSAGVVVTGLGVTWRVW